MNKKTSRLGGFFYYCLVNGLTTNVTNPTLTWQMQNEHQSHL